MTDIPDRVAALRALIDEERRIAAMVVGTERYWARDDPVFLLLPRDDWQALKRARAEHGLCDKQRPGPGDAPVECVTFRGLLAFRADVPEPCVLGARELADAAWALVTQRRKDRLTAAEARSAGR